MQDTRCDATQRNPDGFYSGAALGSEQHGLHHSVVFQFQTYRLCTPEGKDGQVQAGLVDVENIGPTPVFKIRTLLLLMAFTVVVHINSYSFSFIRRKENKV